MEGEERGRGKREWHVKAQHTYRLVTPNLVPPKMAPPGTKTATKLVPPGTNLVAVIGPP